MRVKIATKRKSPHPKDEKNKIESGNELPHSKVRPGDDLEVTITTTDPQGKPVAAELSLAMVEQSLLERFASPLPGIGDFFRGGERQPAVRATSSITFSYRPATQPINPRLLAEKDREEIAKEEEDSRRAAIAVASTTPAAGSGEYGYVSTATLSAGGTVKLGVGVNGDAGLVGNAGDRFDSAMAEVDEAAVPPAMSVDSGDEPVSRLSWGVNGNGNTIHSFQSMGRNSNRQRGYGSMALKNPSQRAPAQQAGANVLFEDYSLGEVSASGEFSDWHMGMDLSVPIGMKQSGFNSVNGVLTLNGGNTFSGGANYNADNLNGLVAAGNTSVLCVDNSGNFRSVRLGDNGELDSKKAAAMAAELNASGAILLSALLPQETGYWNPIVTTGADGRATLTLTVPERSTAWKFLAQGLTAETLAGEATDDLVVKKDLFGEIKLPLAFTDGDTAEIPVTVHNDAVEKGTIEVVLRTTIGGRKIEETKSVKVKGKGLPEVSFKVELKRPVGWDKGASAGHQKHERSPEARTVPPGRRNLPSTPNSNSSSAPPAMKTPWCAPSRSNPMAFPSSAPPAARAHRTKPYGSRPPRACPPNRPGCRSSSARRCSGACWTSCSRPRRGARWKSAASPPGWKRPPATRWPRWACKS